MIFCKMLAKLFFIFFFIPINAMQVETNITTLNSEEPTVIHRLIDDFYALTMLQNNSRLNTISNRIDILNAIKINIFSDPRLIYTCCMEKEISSPILYSLSKNFFKQYILDLIKVLINAADRINANNVLFASDQYGYTALHYAALSNNYEICELVLNRIKLYVSYTSKASIESKKNYLMEKRAFDGRTALHIACANGYQQIFNSLLSHHSNPQKLLSAKDLYHATPIHYLAGKPMHFYCDYIRKILNNLGKISPITLNFSQIATRMLMAKTILMFESFNQQDVDSMLPKDYAKIYGTEEFFRLFKNVI